MSDLNGIQQLVRIARDTGKRRVEISVGDMEWLLQQLADARAEVERVREALEDLHYWCTDPAQDMRELRDRWKSNMLQACTKAQSALSAKGASDDKR